MLEALKTEKYCTFEDWLALDDGVYAELMDGEIFMMAQPLRRHQEVLMELSRQFANFLDGKPCGVYPAPFGVRLTADEDKVFEPDIVVVCDQSKLKDWGCEGAPELVAEILSPSTSRYDKQTKFNEYLRAAVGEYWIVDPADKTVTAHRLKDGEYVTKVYSEPDTVPSAALPGCGIDLSRVFRDKTEQ